MGSKSKGKSKGRADDVLDREDVERILQFAENKLKEKADEAKQKLSKNEQIGLELLGDYNEYRKKVKKQEGKKKKKKIEFDYQKRYKEVVEKYERRERRMKMKKKRHKEERDKKLSDKERRRGCKKVYDDMIDFYNKRNTQGGYIWVPANPYVYY